MNQNLGVRFTENPEKFKSAQTTKNEMIQDGLIRMNSKGTYEQVKGKTYLGLKIEKYETTNIKLVQKPFMLTNYWYTDFPDTERVKYIVPNSEKEELRKYNAFSHWQEHNPFFFKFPPLLKDFVKQQGRSSYVEVKHAEMS